MGAKQVIYLIHFDQPLKHASHYIGFVVSKKGLNKRIERHKSGQGAKILRAANEANINWSVVRTWPDGTRDEERKFKNRKNSKMLCPVCLKK
jgi:predicted GIY-YIG superfamily endonuclease